MSESTWTGKYRIVLVGSAPYVPDWWDANRYEAMRLNYVVAALNNAWTAVDYDIDYWYIPNDFWCTGHKIPTVDDMKDRLRCGKGGMTSAFLERPHWYECPNGTGTMMLNALYDIINRAVIAERPAQTLIAVAGCDLVYKPGETHFYGKGTADPLRYGDAWLIRCLKDMKELCERLGIELRNVGGQSDTRLPFEAGGLT